MTTTEIILLVLLIGVVMLYISSVLKDNKGVKNIVNQVKEDLVATATNVTELVSKAKSILLDKSVQSAIKEFIMIVEEKNKLAKAKGESFLTGDEKSKPLFYDLANGYQIRQVLCSWRLILWKKIKARLSQSLTIM